MSEPRPAAKLLDPAVAFAAGWAWTPLLMGAAIALSTSQDVVAALLVLGGLASLASASALAVRPARPVRVAALAGLALGVVLASALVPVRVPAADPYGEVAFGYLFPFVFADLSGLGDTRLASTVSWDPWEQPAHTSGPRFLLSYVTVLALLTVLSLGVRAGRRRLAGRAAA